MSSRKVRLVRPFAPGGWPRPPPARACEEANSGRRGAAHLTIPVDVFTESAAGTAVRAGRLAPAPPCPDLKQATELLRAAKRPVVIAGSGVWWSGAEEALREFVERTQIPSQTFVRFP